ncbi:uncharacterized protein B0I36DRAFT_321356 [Microdochium trichocladiopsis]|uniref:Transcription factor tau subunit sfc3/Tfc3 C-terminal domain-containing protein n=1 Tax=Microdochium trichocladiopsis TaxID=1682393 RepID=A0A9P9BS19_9PEZI|nr:uncharacterized protein B0I36DRAFT_321356 [Microdochium trichocladiopsis]KAH7033400.1 hypothetical protein B0I36DRAFT_321356 [Microdochium trichocladiopsis]
MPVMTDVTTATGGTPSKAKKRSLLIEKKSTPAKRARLSTNTDISARVSPEGLDSPSWAKSQSRDQEARVALSGTDANVQSFGHDYMGNIDPLLEQAAPTPITTALDTGSSLQTPKVRKKPGPKPGSKRKPREKPIEVESSENAAGLTTPRNGISSKSHPRGSRRTKGEARPTGRAVDYFAASRSEQDAAREWVHNQNLPDQIMSALEHSNQVVALADLEDNDLGDFERSVEIVQHWELGDNHLSTTNGDGSALSEHVFLNHGMATLPQHFMLGELRWLPANQLDENMRPFMHTFHEVPGQSLYSSETPLRSVSGSAVKRLRKNSPSSISTTQSPQSTRKAVQQRSKVLPQRASRPTDYRTRILASLPTAHQGRIHKRRLSTDRMGLRGETDIISAFIIFKILGGGVDRTSDYGMVLKLFPEQSLSGLRRLWGRVIKERKVHIAALSKIFPKAFLAAYKKGELAPLDYDHFDDYDWLSLVKWTSRLRLYEDIDLPADRADFDDEFDLEEPVDQIPDWREMWFSVTSLFSRIDANAGKAASTLATAPQVFDDELILRARSWIRSLTRTQIRGPGTAESIRAKLLELCQGDEDSTNQLLEVVVTQLTDEKFATRTKGKRVGQSIRLNANFSKHFERNAHVDKFAQAVAFKEKMDAAFREGKEFKLSYGADDGSSLAMLNLQAYGRVHVHQTDFRHVPMGHEPGNYEGRKFPKSYYHFTITITPSETYQYNNAMAILEQARLAEVPTKGPNDEIPAWVNLFGKIDYAHWIEYLCSFVFAAATRGPVTAQSMCLIFKPTFELFEAQLILDFVDRLGLLKRFTASSEGATMDEWWWLVIGSLLDEQQKAKGIAAATAAASTAVPSSKV